MITYMRHAGIALAALALAACGAERATKVQPSAVLSDARTDGTAGFYFLPPIAPEPTVETTNDPGLAPVVEIVALDGGGAPGAVLVTFAGDDVKPSGSHYMALWSTKTFVPRAGTTYRIRVLLDGVVLGFADAQVAEDGKALRLLASNEIFGLTGQRTVPIKFRIHVEEQPDACATVTCPAPTQCQLAVACDPAIGACVATPRPASFPCDDGSACTAGDACDGEGSCLAGAPLVCADLDECSVASGCDPAAGCLYTPLVGTRCTQTSGPWAGTPGICRLDATTGRSSCADFGPAKPTF